MYSPVHSPSHHTRGTFSIFIAPSSILSEALNNLLVRHPGNILYICGNFPIILSGLNPNKNQFKVKSVTKADKILSLIESADEPLILFEHEGSLYDVNADLIRPIGQICRKKGAERGTIIMIATRQDGWLKKFEPFAHQIKYQEDLFKYLPKVKKRIRIPLRQRTLEGVV